MEELASSHHFCQRTVGEDSLPGYCPVTLVNRPMRTRLWGGVGAGGEKPPATRLALFMLLAISSNKNQ